MRTEGASVVSVSAPASRTEIGVVYFAAMVQGLALVTFPAASAIFTGPDGFGFDSTRYGAMFVPQVVMAILASGLAPQLARRWGLRRVLLLGIAGDTVSMALLALSRLLLAAPDSAFVVLLVATGALGLGFGATVMALNTYAEASFPGRADGAVLALNALLGLGTALAPLLVAVVTGMGTWWLLPLVVAIILVLIFAVVLAQPPRPDLAIGRGRQRCDRRGCSAAPLLALCGRGISLWHLGDAQWQLGTHISRRRARGAAAGRLHGACGLLGDGDARARARRGTIRARVCALDLPRASGAAAHNVSACLSRPGRTRGHTCVRNRRARVLGVFAAEHQLWRR
jgi:MFS family permease